jgi:hypothetical protein
MGKIYAMAKTVLVWFGSSAERSDLALDTISSVAQNKLAKPLLTRELCNDVLREVGRVATKNPPKLRKTEYLRKDLLNAMGIVAKKVPAKSSLSTDLHNTVLRLIERPWFRRIWVSVWRLKKEAKAY